MDRASASASNDVADRDLPSICVDAFNIALPQGTGIATYGRSLITAICGIGHRVSLLYGPTAPVGRGRRLDETSFGPPKSLPRWRRWLAPTPLVQRPVQVSVADHVGPSGLSGVFPAVDSRWAATDIFHRANRAFSRLGRVTEVVFPENRPDVAHWTAPLPLRARAMANVYTLHDLIPLRLPETTLDNKRTYLALCRDIVRRADLIVTVSETSRADIVSLLGASEDRVINTYQAIEAVPPMEDDQDAVGDVEGGFGLPWGGYFLFWGADEPKKNLDRLIEAYLTSAVSAPLVIAGASGWLTGAREDLDSLSNGRIRRVGYVPRDQLFSLIRGARAALFPSIFEGFGLPALEAMQLGAPVLAGAAGALPEILGEAALMVDPYDVSALRAGIRTLDADRDLRTELVRRGLARAAEFSMQAYQERLKALYARVM